MKTVKDGIKFDLGDVNAMGYCSCYCGTGSGYDAHFAGYDNHSCACACGGGAGRELNFECGHVIAP